MTIEEHFDENNLHHAYLIEGEKGEIVPQIHIYMKTLSISTSSNPDFCSISTDSFKMEEALSLRQMAGEKPISDKKFFLICTNSISLDAQQTLLKIFDEPTPNTHFFVIVPDTGALLPTLISRFYFIKAPTPEGVGVPTEDVGKAEKFLAMSLAKRIDFLKEFLSENEDEETSNLDSARARALKFLNELESTLSKKLKNSSSFTRPGGKGGTYAEANLLVFYFEHIFKVRKFLRQPGSSLKSLMESVALVVPVLQ